MAERTVPRDLSPTGWFHVVRAPRQVSQVSSPTHLLPSQHSGLNRPRHRFSSHADRARPNVPVLRPKAAPPSVAPHPSSSRPFVQGPLPRWCPSAEREPRAGDSNDSSGGAAGTHLRGVSYQQAPGPTHPRPLIGPPRPSLARLKWLREWLLGEACRGWGVAQLSGEEKSEVPVPL